MSAILREKGLKKWKTQNKKNREKKKQFSQ